MVRAALDSNWQCVYANDFDPKKAAAYTANWLDGKSHVLSVADIATVHPSSIPGPVDMAWASFPCQDLSLAGCGRGLHGTRSGTFWPWLHLIASLRDQNRAPAVLVLENVYGTLTSHEGRDFAAIAHALTRLGYIVGGLIADASLFLPQSRPRLFVLAFKPSLVAALPISARPVTPWHPPSIQRAFDRLPEDARAAWVWLSPPIPDCRSAHLGSVLLPDDSVQWDEQAHTTYLLSMMAPAHLSRVNSAQTSGGRVVGTLYRRTRHDAEGRRVQRAEVRFDGVAGCLRTPGGGSSRQTVVLVDGPSVRTRLLHPREAARLMGLPDSYRLPERANEAYHLVGDGVAVPVVQHLIQHLVEPALAGMTPGRILRYVS